MRRLLEVPHFRPDFDVLLIGGSLGSLEPIKDLLRSLPASFPIPTVVAIHRRLTGPDLLPTILGHRSRLDVQRATDHQLLLPGRVYICAPGEHIAIGRAGQCRVQRAPRISHFRPSIDHLFTSSARRFGRRSLAVVLSGRLYDGAAGAKAITDAGGVVIAQSPETSQVSDMPRAVIANQGASYVLDADIIPRAIVSLVTVPGACALFGAHKLSA